jgi:hypothetical protein
MGLAFPDDERAPAEFAQGGAMLAIRGGFQRAPAF